MITMVEENKFSYDVYQYALIATLPILLFIETSFLALKFLAQRSAFLPLSSTQYTDSCTARLFFRQDSVSIFHFDSFRSHLSWLRNHFQSLMLPSFTQCSDSCVAHLSFHQDNVSIFHFDSFRSRCFCVHYIMIF